MHIDKLEKQKTFPSFWVYTKDFMQEFVNNGMFLFIIIMFMIMNFIAALTVSAIMFLSLLFAIRRIDLNIWKAFKRKISKKEYSFKNAEQGKFYTPKIKIQE